eukprot:Gb_41199 [translate_table: standard]
MALLGRNNDKDFVGESNQIEAICFYLQAEDGVGLPTEVLDPSRFERAAKFYFAFLRLDILWSLNLAALVLLNFFEVPLWCSGSSSNSCDNRKDYYLGDLPYLTSKESLLYEVATIDSAALHSSSHLQNSFIEDGNT